VDPLDEEWTTTAEPDAGPSGNGSWDPLAAVMADQGESGPDPALEDELPGVDQDPNDWLRKQESASESEKWTESTIAAPTAPRPTLDDDVEELQFIRLSEAATLPTRANEGDAGLDLYAAEGARIGPGGRVSVGTGLAVAIPPGLAGLVMPRSGLALKHGVTLANSPGLIDSGYRGEVRVLLLNTDGTAEFRISKGERIAQLMLVPIATASPLEASELDQTVRGAGGFGSSGA
jgi:dUTP pyrophosphatase